MQPAFTYYAGDRWPIAPLPSQMPLPAAAVTQALQQFTTGRPQVWLVLWQDYYADPSEVVWTWLWQHFYVADWVNIHGGLKVLRFDTLPAAGLQRSGATLGGQVELVGYTTTPLAAPSGPQVRLDLYWRTLVRPTADMAIATHLLDAAGNDYGDADATPADGRLPTTSWKPGDLVHTTETLPLRPWTAPGTYRVQALMYDHGTQAALPAAGPGSSGTSVMLPIALADIPLGAAQAARLPAGVKPVAADFAGIGTLAGYQMSHGGDHPLLTLYWQAVGGSPQPLKVFVHALDSQSRVLGAGDSEPGAGAAPTTTWTSGELIRDPHQITMSSTGAVAAYEVGIYDPRTGQRVKVRPVDGQPAPANAVKLGA